MTPPDVLAGQGEVVVFGQVVGLHQHGKVQKPPVQPLGQIASVAAVQVHPDAGISRLQGFHVLGQIFDAVGLGGGDVEITFALVK